jgi:peroxiredoxin
MNDEIASLTCQIEELKRRLSEARRRAEPEPIRDYELTGPTGEPVALSELFGDKADLLVVHNMGRGCRYCTMWADGFASMLGHIENRTAFVVVSPDEPEVQQEFAASRGWPFRMVSAAGTTFTQDLGFAQGNDMRPAFRPCASVTTVRSCGPDATSLARATTTRPPGASSTCSKVAPAVGNPNTATSSRPAKAEPATSCWPPVLA